MPAVERRLLLLLVALLAPGCGKIKDLLGLSDEDPPVSPAPEAAPMPVADLGDGAMPPEPLVQATRKLRFPGKSSAHMGFNLAALSRLHALAGAVEIPEWSSPGEGSPRLTRDDDLRTAWTCEWAEDQPCTLGIHFPQPAEVVVIRLYARSSTDSKDHARPRTLRLHTAEGWADARLPDEGGFWHVTLGEPVSTRNLSIEVTEVYKGKGDAVLHFAELEVFGQSGAPRAPLELALDHRIIGFESPVWRSKSRTHHAGQAFVELVDVDGRLRRLLPGSALLGQARDRLMLIERADWTSCDHHQGAYDLLDTQTRVLAPLGDMGGFGADVYRHQEGLGFAVGLVSEYEAKLHGVVLDGETYEHRRLNRLERRAPRELLEAWQIDPTAVSRDDARALEDPPAGCGQARLEDLDALRPQLPKRTKVVAKQWHQCSLSGEIKLLMTTGAQAGKESATHLRMRRLDGESMLVELWGDRESPRLMLANEDGLTALPMTALSLRPPRSCRKRCDAGWANPHVSQ